MRKSKTFQIIVVIALIIILGALSIPKYHQIMPLLTEVLMQTGMGSLDIPPISILLIVWFMELLSVLVNIGILQWIYKSGMFPCSLLQNTIIYLSSAALSKGLTLVVPINVISVYKFIPNIFFLIIFLIVHKILNANLNRKQWGWLNIFTLVNIAISIL